LILCSLLLAWAQAPDLGVADGTASALRGLAATVFVLGLLGTLAWMLRRGTLALPGRKTPGAIRVETAVSLGERRSLVVVAVEGRRLLLGLTPMQVTVVTELSAVPPATFEQSLDGALRPGSGGTH
jgi:flagellar biosynthetic protein FliO